MGIGTSDPSLINEGAFKSLHYQEKSAIRNFQNHIISTTKQYVHDHLFHNIQVSSHDIIDYGQKIDIFLLFFIISCEYLVIYSTTRFNR